MMRQGFLMFEHFKAVGHGWPDANIYLHACIVGMRSVTLLIQKALRHEPGFEEWYGPVQARLRSDAEMRFLVEARNYVLKERSLRILIQHRIEGNVPGLEIHAITEDGPIVWIDDPDNPGEKIEADWRTLEGFTYETHLTLAPEEGLPPPPDKELRLLLTEKLAILHEILEGANRRFGRAAEGDRDS